MKSRFLDAGLTLLGIAGLIIYVLACAPSFSPDGNKVVFPIVDSKTDEVSVSLYDLKKETLETIFVAARSGPLSVQWLPDGEQVLVNGFSYIAILPLGSSNPMRFIPLTEELGDGSLIVTPPVIGKYQFIQAEKSNHDTVLLRANLETLEVQKVPDAPEYQLVAKGDQLYYLTAIKIDEEDALEIGRLDAEKLIRHPIFQMKEMESINIEGFLTPNSDGSRFALTAEVGGIPHILLTQGNALEKSIPVADRDTNLDLGNAEWSPDEKTLYVACVKDLNRAKLWQYGVLEVPIDGGAIRNIPLFTAPNSYTNGDIIFQIALSPDGRRIAATSACLDDVQYEDKALYLVDLGSIERKVTRIVIPLQAGPGASADKK